MVVSEPVKNDPPNPKPIDVQSFQQPPWKALSDFALQSEIEQPGFQHLVGACVYFSWFYFRDDTRRFSSLYTRPPMDATSH